MWIGSEFALGDSMYRMMEYGPQEVYASTKQEEHWQKLSKINLFRTLEINDRLATI